MNTPKTRNSLGQVFVMGSLMAITSAGIITIMSVF